MASVPAPESLTSTSSQVHGTEQPVVKLRCPGGQGSNGVIGVVLEEVEAAADESLGINDGAGYVGQRLVDNLIDRLVAGRSGCFLCRVNSQYR